MDHGVEERAATTRISISHDGRKVYDSGAQPSCTRTVINVQPCQAHLATGRDVIFL
jgi:hypothetical protein